MSADTIIRAQVLHTPRDPFDEPRALEAFSDGALAVREGRIAAVGDWERVRAEHPDADVEDHRDALLLPGLVDLHVHYPQVAVIGAMGLELLEWLQTRTLPEEARLADTAYAREVAHGFVRALADRWHGRGRLRYAVTPRFSLSCTDTMLEACGALLGEHPGLLFTSHINENPDEIRAVADLFPWARDYLDTYERYGLVGPESVLAHDVHVGDDELRRLAAARGSVAHCPSSNAFLGSGIFAMARHHRHGVRFGLGTDVGAGTGLSLFKEGLMAYHVQMVRPEGHLIGPAHL